MKPDDLAFLMEHLHQFAYKWREIGLALRFRGGELECMVSSLPGAPVQRLLVELLSQWSQWPTATHTTPPTMERLRDALRSNLVGLGAEANEIYDKRHQLPSRYVIGMLCDCTLL